VRPFFIILSNNSDPSKLRNSRNRPNRSWSFTHSNDTTH